MAEATLRAYLKEIDDLIEREQLDEAIAHCRHILQVYPKHLDTYRLLGKAYLEAKRFGDAADIFQRVLSAVPDDFVAHVGMSIVREDEGNTDAAIWHMERAFETTPANPAIQQELRRLIGRRDGIEPHKVRLTRGALARMYAHGELYPQAVAELRAALQEDPERADLQVVLAEMYWRTGQRAESVEVANKIIEKLPYCREANRILAAAYQSSGRTEEAATHHRRLATLDPYAAFIETPMTDPQTVDPGSVRVDRLEWAPGQSMPLGQPEWASSLSADLRAEPPPQPVSGPVPSWLEEPAPARPPERPTPPPPPTPQPAAALPTPPSGMDIPTWMREAGWSPSTGAAVEGPVGFTEDEITTLETGGPPAAEGGALAPGEIPEWLRAVAPKQPPPQESLTEAWGDELAPSAETASVAPPWLGEPEASLEPEPQAEAPWEPPVVEAEPQPVEPEVQLPEDWGAQIAEAAPIEDADLESQALPSWLEEPSPGATDTIITWLGDRAARDTGDLAMPAWMNEGAPREIPSAPAVEEPAVPSLSAEEPEEEVPAPEAGSPQAALPGWLAGVADAAAQQEPLPAEDLAWLRERGETAPRPEGEEWPGGPAEPEEEAPMASREAPDWLRGIVEPGAEPEAPAEPEAGPSWLAGAEIPRARIFAPAPEPDWLRGLGEPSPATPEMPQEVREAPGWLKSIQQSREPQPKAEEAAPSWMQAPAEQIGAGVGEGEEEGEWLAEVGEEVGGSEPVDEMPSEEGASLVEAELPDWLSSMAPPEAPPSSTEMPSEEELGGALGWLEAPAEGREQEVVEEARLPLEEPKPVAAAQLSGEDDVLEWLESLAAQQPAGDVGMVAEAEVEGEEEPLVEERVLPEEPAEGLEWLERLAASRGVEPEEEAAAPEAAAMEAAPDWLRGDLEEPSPSLEPAEAEPADSLDWLQAEEEETPALELPADIFEAEAEAPAYEGDTHVPTWILDASKAPLVVEAASMPPSMEETLPASFEEQAEAFPGDTAVPDWLRAPSVPPAVPAPEAAAVPAPSPEPDWIGPAEEPVLPIAAEIAAAVPDWLRTPAETPPAAQPVPAEEESVWEAIPVARAPERPAPAPAPAPTRPEPVPEPVFDVVPPVPVEPEFVSQPTFEVVPPAPVEPPLLSAEPGLAPALLPPAAAEPVYSPPPALPEPERIAPPPPAAPAAPPLLEPVLEPPLPEPVFEPAPIPAPPPTEPSPVAPPQAPPPYTPPPPQAPAPAAAPPPAYAPPQAPAPLPTSAPAPAQWEPAPAFAPPPAPQAAPPPYAPPSAPTYPPPITPAYPPPAPAYPPQPTYQPPAAAPQPPYWPPYPPGPAYTPPQVQAAPYAPPTYAPAAPAPPAPAAASPKPRAGGPSPEEVLEQARSAMDSGDIEGALLHYGALIKKKRQLNTVIDDLKSVVDRATMPPAVWQALGDAYMKADRLPEAIESYRHGLEAV